MNDQAVQRVINKLEELGSAGLEAAVRYEIASGILNIVFGVFLLAAPMLITWQVARVMRRRLTAALPKREGDTYDYTYERAVDKMEESISGTWVVGGGITLVCGIIGLFSLYDGGLSLMAPEWAAAIRLIEQF